MIDLTNLKRKGKASTSAYVLGEPGSMKGHTFTHTNEILAINIHENNILLHYSLNHPSYLQTHTHTSTKQKRDTHTHTLVFA